jgi:hypothetical protein
MAKLYMPKKTKGRKRPFLIRPGTTFESFSDEYFSRRIR